MEISTQDNIQPLLQQLPSALFQVSSEGGGRMEGERLGGTERKRKRVPPMEQQNDEMCYLMGKGAS